MNPEEEPFKAFLIGLIGFSISNVSQYIHLLHIMKNCLLHHALFAWEPTKLLDGVLDVMEADNWSPRRPERFPGWDWTQKSAPLFCFILPIASFVARAGQTSCCCIFATGTKLYWADAHKVLVFNGSHLLELPEMLNCFEFTFEQDIYNQSLAIDFKELQDRLESQIS